METFKILEKHYNMPKFSAIKALEFILKDDLKELDVTLVSTDFEKDNYAEITIEGQDEVIAKNFLTTKYGTCRSITEIKQGDILRGRLKDVGKINFGTFVELGVTTSTKAIDALYPLFEMRTQLASDNKVSASQIAKVYGLIENLPLLFEVTEKHVLQSKIRVKLSSDSVLWLQEMLDDTRSALIISGVTRRMIKVALKKTHHYEDIEEIERMGLLEYKLICKKGTNADGLVPEIGYLLKQAKIGIQMSSRLKQLLKKEQ